MNAGFGQFGASPYTATGCGVHATYGAVAVGGYGDFGGYGNLGLFALPSPQEALLLGVQGLREKYRMAELSFQIKVASAAVAARVPGAMSWLMELNVKAGDLGVQAKEERRQIEETTKWWWERIPWWGWALGGVALLGTLAVGGGGAYMMRRNPAGRIQYHSKRVKADFDLNEYVKLLGGVGAIGLGVWASSTLLGAVVGLPLIAAGFYTLGTQVSFEKNPRKRRRIVRRRR